jgi:DNA-binding NtrC family response regulator
MPEKKKILVAEDDLATHEDWCGMLASWGYEVKTAEDGQKALDLLHSFQPHILLADLKMPHRNGLDLLRDISELQLEIVPIIISGAGEIPDAVEAIKLGASDYLCKPIDPPRLQKILQNLAEHMDVREENLRLRRRLAEVGELGPLFGKSPAMRRSHHRQSACTEVGNVTGGSVADIGAAGWKDFCTVDSSHHLPAARAHATVHQESVEADTFVA